jgi:hypothetical protein
MAGIPKLIVLSEQLRGKRFELTLPVHTCGRVEDRDICLKDPTISSYHCDFIKSESGETYILRDKNSTNGTRVNNVPVTEQELQNSDIIQIGGVEVLYDCDDKSVTTVMRTQTGIDLNNSDASLSSLKNMNKGFDRKRRGGGVSQKIIVSVVVLLVIIILGLLGFLLYKMFVKPAPIPLDQAPGMVVFPVSR